MRADSAARKRTVRSPSHAGNITSSEGPITAIADLRDVLGDQTYESLARKGETMTIAAMATYAYDQIDRARTELKGSSKWATL
jgi:hypothetical protein